MTQNKNGDLAAISLIVLLVLIFAGLEFGARAQSVHQSSGVGGGYVPQRVYDSGEKRFTDFEAMLFELSRAEVVFVGEQHNDPATHRLERAILEGLARRRDQSSQSRRLVLSLEMFERDVQPALDDYLAGRKSEEEFLKVSRPWPNYATDYRPLVEFARAHNWPVLASNVPRRFASQVAKQGLTSVETAPEAERKLIAAQIQCPIDDYFKRFSETMGRHPGSDGKESEKKPDAEQKAMIERFFFAQCIKDETMAESVANQFETGVSQNRPLVVHFNGAFHSDFRLGTAARVARRLPKLNLKVVTVVPVENLDVLKVDEYRKRGDYIIFTIQPVKPKTGPEN